MSKVSFRARQIDFNKPIPILRHDSELLSEISENALVNRGVPSIPSGMEKEEENEHHFVEVIHALQSRKEKADVFIPVPEIVEDYQKYYNIYPKGFEPPSQYIHLRTEDEPVEYDMDSDDEEWLRKSELNIGPEKFESMIDKLERGCGQKVMNLEEAKYLLQDDQSLVIAIYDYWLTKRVQCRQPLLLAVRQEKREGCNSISESYVAFRRRTERMQTRKNRKNDENAYEKMLILREKLESAGELLSSVFKREQTKERLVLNDRELFEARLACQDFDASLLHEAEVALLRSQPPASAKGSADSPRKSRNVRKRKALDEVDTESPGSPLLSPSDSGPPQFAFVRVPGCRYLKPIGRYSNFAAEDTQTPYSCLGYRLATVPAVEHPERHFCTGYVRRRLGRGGRLLFDRVLPDAHLEPVLRAHDEQLAQLAPDPLEGEVRRLDRLQQLRLHLASLTLRLSGSPSLHVEQGVRMKRCKFDDRPPASPQPPENRSESPVQQNGFMADSPRPSTETAGPALVAATAAVAVEVNGDGSPSISTVNWCPGGKSLPRGRQATSGGTTASAATSTVANSTGATEASRSTTGSYCLSTNTARAC